LLWHGSRFSNFVGILSQGLRIAPPEAPSTGYNFGKGVYFADIIEKSFPYACPYLSNNVGVYILAEVALGNTRELKSPDYNAANLPADKHSTHALGTR
jgi:poly [ADP-ribose] polymerase